MDKLVIGDHVIPYEEKKSMRAKRIIITVFTDKVRVSVPRWATNNKIKEFVSANRDQILEHWLKLKARQTSPDLSQGVSMEIPLQGTVPFLGKRVFYQAFIQKRVQVGLKYTEPRLEIFLPEGTGPKERSIMIKKALIYWYKKEARRVMLMKLAHYAACMKVQYGQVRLKEQRTKWGSCSGKGNINLNWQIIRAPEKVVDYVLIHELAHLKHMNHSSEFWQVVAQAMPDYKVWKKWLKEHGKELVL